MLNKEQDKDAALKNYSAKLVDLKTNLHLEETISEIEKKFIESEYSETDYKLKYLTKNLVSSTGRFKDAVNEILKYRIYYGYAIEEMYSKSNRETPDFYEFEFLLGQLVFRTASFKANISKLQQLDSDVFFKSYLESEHTDD